MAWWLRYEGKLDLAGVLKGHRRPGLYLCRDESTDKGSVWLVGSDGVTRWRLDDLKGPRDASFTPDGRVLVAESPSERRGNLFVAPMQIGFTPGLAPPTPRPQLDAQQGVSERRLDGTVVWRNQHVAEPIICERLANGETFVAGPTEKLTIVGVDGKSVDEHALKEDWEPAGRTLRRLPGGLVFSIHPGPRGELFFRVLDPVDAKPLDVVSTGRKVDATPVGGVPVESRDYFLYPSQTSTREIDAEGRTVADVPRASDAKAVCILNGIGPEAELAVPALIKVMHDWSATFELREQAAMALASIGRPVPKIVEAIRRAKANSMISREVLDKAIRKVP